MKRAIAILVSIAAVALGAAGCQKGTLKVEACDPPQGTIAGGEEITIVGDGFEPGKTQAEVIFGHKKSESVMIAATTKIKAVSPPGDKGPVDVTINFDDGRTFKIPNAFRYVEPGDQDSVRKAWLSGNKAGGGSSKIELENHK